MNLNENRYTSYALVQEMLDTPNVISRFNFDVAPEAVESLKQNKKIFLTGEGSSRIFPGKNFVYNVLEQGIDLNAHTEGSRQTAEYNVMHHTVLGASNSGRTAEVVSLFRELKDRGHKSLFSVSSYSDTPLGAASTQAYVLTCGAEKAVAATKSVVEQALFYHAILEAYQGSSYLRDLKTDLADSFSSVLAQDIDRSIVELLAKSNVLHWAGRNNGVAEELTLKTYETSRKRSAFLSGTYAVHGIEEVMSNQDAVVVVDPFEEEERKFEEVLVKGVGCPVIAISSRQTSFPTIKIPEMRGCNGYLQLAAGWNLLVELALEQYVDLDKPQRARKVGNEFVQA